MPTPYSKEMRWRENTGGSTRWLRPVLWLLGVVVISPAWAASASSVSAMKKLSFEELLNVEVMSVSRAPEKLSETASAIQVVTADQIRRSGASTLPEALRLADNLDVAQKGAHDWGISARGFNTELANKLLVMIDGRTVYTPLFSGVLWDVQDYLLEDIDRIEVISGPGGMLWGSNAVNGVINIITRSAKDSQGLFVQAGGGSAIPAFGGIRYGGSIAPGIYYRVYGKYLERDAQVLSGGGSAGDASHRSQGGFRIDSEASPQNTFTLSGDFYQGRSQLTAGGENETRGGNLLGRWTHFLPGGSDLSLLVYYDRTELRQPAPELVINGLALAPAGVFEDNLDTIDVDFQHRLSVGDRHCVVWGLGYRFTHIVVANAPSLAFFPARLDQEMIGGFVQDTIDLGDDASLTLGSKLEHNDYTGLEIEPSVRLQWTPSATQNIWAAVSRAVRRPSRIDRDLSQGAPPFFVLLTGGRDFESEKVIAYELGHRAQLARKLGTSVTFFYNEYDDVRSTGTTPATLVPLVFENNLEGHTYGMEFAADYEPLPGWRLHAGFNVLQEDLRIKAGQTDVNNALNETSDPEHQFVLRSSWDLPRSVELDVGLRWVDDRPGHSGPTPGTLPGYVELDVRLGWHPTDSLELAIIGQNLLDGQHPEYGFPSPATVEIRRSVMGKATWRF